jgi:sugar lactone lactonase YvrE
MAGLRLQGFMDVAGRTETAQPERMIGRPGLADKAAVVAIEFQAIWSFKGGIVMRNCAAIKRMFGLAVLAATALTAAEAAAQGGAVPSGLPTPYRMLESWVQIPEGRVLGNVIAVEVDRDGKSIWAFERCGANDCAKSNLAPIMKFDPSGKMVANFGAGMFNFPHGLGLDRDGNVYVTDGRGEAGKGHTVVKFSPDGKVLMTLGQPGVAGDGPDTFNAPSDVAVAANGDIYVADGHGEKTNARVVKLSKDGKFIKAWGKVGKAPGEFDTLHGIALDSSGNVYVADRSNSRIQVFDGDGKFLAEWKQFGRPSNVSIDKNDAIYVTDDQSDEKRNPGFQKGVRIGNAKDGKVSAFIADDPKLGSPEGVAADDQGNIYGAYAGKHDLKKFVKN